MFILSEELLGQGRRRCNKCSHLTDSPAGGRGGEGRRRADGEKKEGCMEGRGLREGCLEGKGSHRENLERWSAAVWLEVRSMEPIERLRGGRERN